MCMCVCLRKSPFILFTVGTMGLVVGMFPERQCVRGQHNGRADSSLPGCAANTCTGHYTV